MSRVGFIGGGSLFEIGCVHDVCCFYALAFRVAESNPSYKNYLNRLYMKYLRYEELDESLLMMRETKAEFEKTEAAGIDWGSYGYVENRSKLNISKGTLKDIFQRYFDGFEHCVEASTLSYEIFGEYQPVMTVISDIPTFITESRRPLSEYDALTDDAIPFWQRGQA